MGLVRGRRCVCGRVKSVCFYDDSLRKRSNFDDVTLPRLLRERCRCVSIELATKMRLRAVATVVAGGFAMAALAAPSSNLQLSEYQKQDWQVEDGLPENSVRMIAQRRDQTLTEAGSSNTSCHDGQDLGPPTNKDPS